MGESAIVRALRGIDAALEMSKTLVGAAVDVANRSAQSRWLAAISAIMANSTPLAGAKRSMRSARSRAKVRGIHWEGGNTESIAEVARRRLVAVDSAEELNDLLIPPGNRLEALGGDRKGQHSIRINDQYRICFVWKEGHAEDVEITKHYR